MEYTVSLSNFLGKDLFNTILLDVKVFDIILAENLVVILLNCCTLGTKWIRCMGASGLRFSRSFVLGAVMRCQHSYASSLVRLSVAMSLHNANRNSEIQASFPPRFDDGTEFTTFSIIWVKIFLNSSEGFETK